MLVSYGLRIIYNKGKTKRFKMINNLTVGNIDI